MKRHTILASLILLAVVFHSCGGPGANVLRVTSALPSGVVGRDLIVPVTFSRGIVPVDSLNQWSSTPYITFSPEIPGKFIWEDTTRLVFSPDGQLPGDARFTAKLNTELLTKMSGATGFDGAAEFSFETESFRLKSAEFFYDRIGQKREIGIRANLEFTYAVNAADVQSMVAVKVDNEQKPLANVATTGQSRVIAVDIGTVTQLEKERVIAVSCSGDLTSPETGTRIRKEDPLVYRMPPLGELQILGHDVGSDGTTGWIKVRTSQEVDAEVAKAGVTIDPARPFTVRNDGDGFTLQGSFEPGAAFRLSIKKGLESVLGGKTQNAYEADIVIGNVAPSFGFASSSGMYMMMGGARSIDIKTVNLSRLAVRVSQIFQNNIVYLLDNGRYYDYSYYGDDEGGGQSWVKKYRYYVGNYGRQLSYDTISIANVANREITTPFSLTPFMNTGYKGFYLVEIANPEESWRSTSKLISISDIGLIAKTSYDEVQVFATNLVTTAPMPNVTISLISTTNQTVASVKTDPDGVARFTGMAQKMKDFPLRLVTAEADNDFNFLHLDDYRVETSRFDVAGRRDLAGPYDALLYGDRNIYRPGERVIVAGLVRNLSNPVPAGMPVRLKLFSPRGSLVQETQHTLNDQGSFESSFQTSTSAATGDYRYELYTGSNVFLTSYKVSVEDFVPDRLRVNLTPTLETASLGETIEYSIQATNFFGPPAAGRNWEFEGAFTVVPYVSKNFPDFAFRDDAAANNVGEPVVATGRTESDGTATVSMTIPDGLSTSGIIRARGRVGVFDESGRPVYQVAQTMVYPKDYLIGVKNAGAYYVAPNTPQKMRIVAVNPQDQVLKGFTAEITLVRFEWHSVLRQHPQTKNLRYVSERREIPVRTDRVTIGTGPVDYTYAAPRSGDYALRVSKAGDSGYNQIEFYSYSWGTSDMTSFEVDPEARVDIVPDKKVYAPGDKAHILFQAPFSGKMLVTIERNHVFKSQYLDVVNNAASMDVDITDAHLPTVYVAAVLFRKINDVHIPLLAGHGFAPLMVERKSNKLDVQIRAPERIRPRGMQTITVTVSGESGVALTLAAVDEGICQVKNYKTPDPYGYFYARRALETDTHDFFKHLLPEPDRSRSSSTGGGEAEMGKRTNPLGVQRFKPLALWSGILTTDGHGEANIPLTIPEFNGEVRLMAFAYKGDRFGSSEKAMKVSDKIVITPALPRFVAPGDSFSMPLTAFNTTASATTVLFDVETAGPLRTVQNKVDLEIGANQERYTPVTLVAGPLIGAASVKVHARALGEVLESSTDIPVRPAASFATDAITGMVEGGKSVSHPIGDVYLAAGRKAYVTLSPYPVASFAGQLKSLLGYPHGCLEQTVSRAFPQIYLRDIASILAPTALAGGSPTYYVNEAITKISGMQLQDGGFSYWPGGTDENDWTTVYATHFLLEAKKGGYAVMDATLSSALGAVAKIARDRKTEDRYFWEGNKTMVRRIAAKSSLYALYVLALAGRPEQSVMSFYRNERSLLTTDTRYLLAGAYALAGDRRTYSDILPGQFAVDQATRESGGDLDSPVRSAGVMLNVLLETDLNSPHVPRLMEYLSKAYKADEWYSTQDNAFMLLAFGKAARMASAAKVSGKVKVGTKEYAYSGGTQRIDCEPYGKTVTLAMEGNGRVYYTVAVEGIRTDGKVKMEDRNLQVRRDLLTRSGAVVNGQAVKQNDLLVVRITLTSSVDRLDYVAVSDLLPAGLEIENPRLTEATAYPFIGNATVPEYMDIRDDRINLYTSFRGGKRQQVFYYAVRAVTAGSFVYPPVTAEAMYDGRYSSTAGAGTFRVVR